MPPTLVIDWDGTVTAIDGLHLVLLEFGDRDIYEEHESRLGRDLTLHEVIAGEFRSVRAPLDEVVALDASRTPGSGRVSRTSRASTGRSSSRAASTS